MCDKKIEQRVVIKFLVKFGENPTEIFRKLKHVFGNECFQNFVCKNKRSVLLMVANPLKTTWGLVRPKLWERGKTSSVWVSWCVHLTIRMLSVVFYIYVSKRSCTRATRVRLLLANSGWILHHDNEPVHMDAYYVTVFGQKHYCIAPNPACSSEIVRMDF